LTLTVLQSETPDPQQTAGKAIEDFPAFSAATGHKFITQLQPTTRNKLQSGTGL
jgi:hypothetical protein